MPLETIIAAVMIAALIIYALLGGADYGGGVWDLFAFGKRAPAQRHSRRARVRSSAAQDPAAPPPPTLPETIRPVRR